MDSPPPIQEAQQFSALGRKSAELKFPLRNRTSSRSKTCLMAICALNGTSQRQLGTGEGFLFTHPRVTTRVLSAIRFYTFNMGGARMKQAGVIREMRISSWTT